MPPSASHLGAGDVLELEGQRYRVDRVEQAEAQLIDAVHVESGVWEKEDLRIYSEEYFF